MTDDQQIHQRIRRPDEGWEETGFEAFNLLPGTPYSFASQVGQYPEVGEPDTIELFLGEVPSESAPVNCLLWRDHEGLVRGILNHYPVDYTLEKAGNINMFVHPDWKRKGIGTALADRATHLWGQINFDQQKYSAEGLNAMLWYRDRSRGAR